MTSTPTLIAAMPLDEMRALDAVAFQDHGVDVGMALLNYAKDKDNLARLMPQVRDWLDEAGQRQLSATARVWGFLCMSLLREQSTAIEKKHFLADRDRIAAYLHGMSNVEEHDLFHLGGSISIVDVGGTKRYTTRPACDALNGVLGLLAGSNRGGSTPMLEALMDTDAWNPGALLERMHAFLPQQMAYLRAIHGHAGMEATMPHGRLLRLLDSATLTTDWLPDDTSLFSELWDGFCGINPSEEQATTLQARLLQSMPSHTMEGLALVVHNEGMTPAQAELFFPLPVEQSSPDILLGRIVDILAMTRADASSSMALAMARSKRFEDKLAEHHPQLFELLSLHFSLFPDTSRFEPNTAMLADAYKRSLSQPNTLGLPPLFEDPTHAS